VTGLYENEEIGGKLIVREKRGELIFSKGIVKIKTIPVSRYIFYAPENRAFFHFQKDGLGGVTSFLINASDFRNFRFIKR
jgi:hypothetical protein